MCIFACELEDKLKSLWHLVSKFFFSCLVSKSQQWTGEEKGAFKATLCSVHLKQTWKWPKKLLLVLFYIGHFIEDAKRLVVATSGWGFPVQIILFCSENGHSAVFALLFTFLYFFLYISLHHWLSGALLCSAASEHSWNEYCGCFCFLHHNEAFFPGFKVPPASITMVIMIRLSCNLFSNCSLHWGCSRPRTERGVWPTLGNRSLTGCEHRSPPVTPPWREVQRGKERVPHPPHWPIPQRQAARRISASRDSRWCGVGCVVADSAARHSCRQQNLNVNLHMKHIARLHDRGKIGLLSPY